MAGRIRETYRGGFGTENAAHEYSEPGHTLIHTDLSYTGKLWHKLIKDQVTPDFHSLLKCGKFLPPNPVYILEEEELRTPGDAAITGPTTTVEGPYWFYNPPSVSIPPVNPSYLDEAVLAAAANAASASWDYLTFLGELKDSVNMLAGIARTFNTQTRALAIQAAKDWRKNPWKEFQNLWLGYRYGVRPMIYDAQNILQALQTKATELVTGKSRYIEPIALNGSTTFDIAGRYDCTVIDTIAGSRQYRGWAAADVDVFQNAQYQADPLVTLWELTKYSFVVDRFINIGNLVSTLRPQITGGYRGVMGSTKLEYTHSQVINIIPKSPWSGDWGTIITQKKVREYQRDAHGIPLPHFHPRLDIPFIIDLAALFIRGRDDVGRILSRRNLVSKRGFGRGKGFRK